jgi:hypothetical protein
MFSLSSSSEPPEPISYSEGFGVCGVLIVTIYDMISERAKKPRTNEKGLN